MAEIDTKVTESKREIDFKTLLASNAATFKTEWRKYPALFRKTFGSVLEANADKFGEFNVPFLKVIEGYYDELKNDDPLKTQEAVICCILNAFIPDEKLDIFVLNYVGTRYLGFTVASKSVLEKPIKHSIDTGNFKATYMINSGRDMSNSLMRQFIEWSIGCDMLYVLVGDLCGWGPEDRINFDRPLSFLI